MRALHVIPSLSSSQGGPSFALPLMARGLCAAGVQVDVATTDDDGPHDHVRLNLPLGRCIKRDGAGYFYFRKQTEFYKVSLPFRQWILKQCSDYDIIHVHALFSFTSSTAARAARRASIPYVIRPLGALNRWGMAHRRRWLKALSVRFIEQPILRHAAAIHYTSRQERQEAEEAGTRGHAVVIPLGVDVAQFHDLPPPSLFFERFREAVGHSLVLFLSRLDAKKGLDLLLPALSEVRRNHPEARLVIAGDGDRVYVEQLRAVATQLGIADQLIWTGFLSGSEKLSAFAAATLFILPSYSENFGIALVEALAAGLPSILTSGVGVADDIREFDAGFVVQPEISELASALNRVLGDSELRSRLSANAVRLAHTRFSLEAMGGALKELYERILEKAP